MNQVTPLPEHENQDESEAPHLVARQTGDVEQTVDHGVAVANTGPVAGNITVNVAPETETAVEVDEWWRRWASSLPAPFLLADRHDAVTHLRECLNAKPTRPIGLYGPSRDEVIAFTAAALLTEHHGQPVDPDSFPVAYVVFSVHAWTHLAAGPPSILIALFDVPDADLAGAISAGHHVIRPMWPPDDMARATICLPRIARDEGSDELIMAGWTPRAADRDAALGRRNLRALRRKLAADPRADPHSGWTIGKLANY
ncbi:hypothetical protein [Saccharopolyspora shandongensis]|uniref:hypothetical protein n=1 Tax=Saccharopolyspora shandongensis TaxID=418495 RepID=UPI0033DDDEA9